MPSSFSWLDYSEHERRQALEVIDLFREEGTQDELGLGVIRDTFSDLFFPGTSTIQTRLRYFLFVPWVLQELESKKVLARDFPQKSRQVQDRLRRSLMEGGEELGVIGYRAGIDVQRLPSSVYWQGIHRWGILRFHGSEEDFRRGLDFKYERSKASLSADDGEIIDSAVGASWDPYLPKPPEGFLQVMTFSLTAEEGDFLTHRLAMSAPRSLFKFLLECGEEIGTDTRFPWEFVSEEELPENLRKELMHARCFSEVMHGAALLYNLILSEETQQEENEEYYREWLEEWWNMIKGRRSVFSDWNRNEFWKLVRDSGGRIPARTVQFVEGWWEFVFNWPSIQNLLSSRQARILISDRELQLKRGRARIGNPRARELWSGAAGTGQLDYRWNRPVRTLINDLLQAGQEDDDA